MKINNPIVIVVVILVAVGGYFIFSKESADDNSGAQPILQNSDDPKLSINTDSVQQGWSVVLVGADLVTKDHTVFSTTITDLGQKIERGSLSWAPYMQFTTAGKFVEVDLKMNNTGRQGEAIQATFAGLFDQADRSYNYQFGHSSCGGTGGAGIHILQPNIPCTAKGVFEVSQDSTSFTLKLFYKKEN